MGRPKKLSILEQAREDRLAFDRDLYAAHKAARRPWLTIPEAAHELDLSESRISQLISGGAFALKPNVSSRRVSAVDVYAYKPQPRKKRAAA